MFLPRRVASAASEARARLARVMRCVRARALSSGRKKLAKPPRGTRGAPVGAAARLAAAARRRRRAQYQPPLPGTTAAPPAPADAAEALAREQRLRASRAFSLSSSVKGEHGRIAADVAARRERERKDRLKALQANDLSAYLRMSARQYAPGVRIQELLQRTDTYLQRLSSRIRAVRAVRSTGGAAEEQEEVLGEEPQAATEPPPRPASAAAAAGDASAAAAAGGASAAEGGEQQAQQQCAPQQQPAKPRAPPPSREELAARVAATSSAFSAATAAAASVQQPAALRATLRPYQLTGLRWLAALYSNGLNGILADEMGLGKTVQCISLLLHLVEKEGVRGPFLVVAPSSVLANWKARRREGSRHVSSPPAA